MFLIRVNFLENLIFVNKSTTYAQKAKNHCIRRFFRYILSLVSKMHKNFDRQLGAGHSTHLSQIGFLKSDCVLWADIPPV